MDDMMSLEFIERRERFWTNGALMHFQIIAFVIIPVGGPLTKPRGKIYDIKIGKSSKFQLMQLNNKIMQLSSLEHLNNV